MLEIRRFLLLTPDHQPLLSLSGHRHFFNNRWPRDAALKVASRNEFYPDGVDEIEIYLREVKAVTPESASTEEARPTSNIVHVYRGSRSRKPAVDIPKFASKKFMWVPRVMKVREERVMMFE